MSPILKRSIVFGPAALWCLMAVNAWADTAPPASAPPPASRAVVREACSHDFQTLCGAVKPGEGRVRACIKDHFRDLSPGCKQAIRENRRERPGN